MQSEYVCAVLHVYSLKKAVGDLEDQKCVCKMTTVSCSYFLKSPLEVGDFSLMCVHVSQLGLSLYLHVWYASEKQKVQSSLLFRRSTSMFKHLLA